MAEQSLGVLLHVEPAQKALKERSKATGKVKELLDKLKESVSDKKLNLQKVLDDGLKLLS